jgi:putative addiction module killer protein
MIEVRETEEFSEWLEALKDLKAQARIAQRVRNLAHGLMGDVQPVGEGVSELRIHLGPGYRVYIKQRGRVLTVVLCGGDKSTQASDIARALALARGL